ncbi:MAG TPA: copper chaperone PCu(A)C, partial [Pseudomonadales bacterium]|nr:copper chaperone PCu(A)C [Pseudomonadales bacterium]
MVKLMRGAVLALSCFSVCASAADEKAGTIKIENAWVREVPPTASNSAGYLDIVNSGEADHLLSVQSTVAKSTEMHEMKMEKGVMEMNRLTRVDIPVGQTVKFEPGGMHV